MAYVKRQRGQGVTNAQMVATGGFRTPYEMAKAFALGADAVALVAAGLIAVGRLARFLNGATAMMVDYARICGRRSLGTLARSDLATLDPELARRTDLEWVV